MSAVADPKPFVPPWQRRRPLKPVEPAESAKGGGDSPYKLGYKFEVAVRGRLQRRRYFVQRAALSKTKVDLLAGGPVCVARGISALFIQCKRRGDIGSEEWNALFAIAQEFGGWAIVALRESPKTVSFYRIDAPREFRKPGRPWTLIDPATLEELLPPPSLLG